MTAALRKLPSQDTSATLPYDALDWQNKAHREVAALWRYIGAELTSVAGTNTITATSDTAVVSALGAYATGQKFLIIPANDNTDAVTLNIDSLGAKDWFNVDGDALQAGDLKAGRLYLIAYVDGAFRTIAGDSGGGIVSVAADIVLRDEKSQNTNGGTFTSGAWQTRTLNTAVRNVITGASLASNQFTLPPGTYMVQWSAPAFIVSSHQTRLQNITDGSTVEEGQSCVASSSSNGFSLAQGLAVFTITSSKTFELQHRCATTGSSTGFGSPNNFTTEVYACVYVWKVMQSSELVGPTGPGYAATSTTSLAIGTGTKAFTTTAGLAYSTGARVRAASASGPTNWMEGQVTSYSGTTLTISADLTSGSGTKTDWNINLAGEQGATGLGALTTESMVIAASDETTVLTTGTAKVTFRIPYNFTLSDVRASLTVAQSSGSVLTVDINQNGTSILSTKITIDNTEKTSKTAATPAVISTTALLDDDEITIDIDQIGSGDAKGLKIYLIGALT